MLKTWSYEITEQIKKPQILSQLSSVEHLHSSRFPINGSAAIICPNCKVYLFKWQTVFFQEMREHCVAAHLQGYPWMTARQLWWYKSPMQMWGCNISASAPPKRRFPQKTSHFSRWNILHYATLNVMPYLHVKGHTSTNLDELTLKLTWKLHFKLISVNFMNWKILGEREIWIKEKEFTAQPQCWYVEVPLEFPEDFSR